jgi:hypothetical protein
MTTQEAMSDVESLGFSARVNIASSYGVFRSVLEDSEAVGFLLSQTESTDACLELLWRIQSLSEEVEEHYRHRYDAALAAYVFVLSQKHEGVARTAARNLVRRDDMWWARIISGHLLQDEKKSSGASLRTQTWASGATLKRKTHAVPKQTKREKWAPEASRFPEHHVWIELDRKRLEMFYASGFPVRGREAHVRSSQTELRIALK